MTGAPVRAWTALARDDAHGPLPLLLLVLTTATGVVDAISILGLGHVFVANMTGNVAFIGFALAGAAGFSLPASLAALVGFIVGASTLGGVAVRRWGAHRGRLLRNATLIEVGLFAPAIALAAVAPPAAGAASEWALAGLLAFTMGLQNAAVRGIAVPDLTTSVVTMTLTGLAADGRRGGFAAATRRTSALVTMAAGALVGALLMMRIGTIAALVLTTVLIGATAVVAALVGRGSRPWHTRPRR
jgi:uncharacterized membrane protein YoaK (UPF0700 family)